MKETRKGKVLILFRNIYSSMTQLTFLGRRFGSVTSVQHSASLKHYISPPSYRVASASMALLMRGWQQGCDDTISATEVLYNSAADRFSLNSSHVQRRQFIPLAVQ